MDIYECILLRVLKTGYRARNSNTYVADAVIQTIADCATKYGCASMSTTYLDQDPVDIPRSQS